MPISDRAIVVKIIIKEEAAVRGLRRMDRSLKASERRADSYRRRIDRLTRAHKRFARSSVFSAKAIGGTLLKASVSMVGVLAIWNTTIVPLEAGMRALGFTITEAAKAVADFEMRVVSMQAVLATTARFSRDVGENFKIAGDIAQNVMLEIIARNKETIATIDEIALAYQVLLSSGARKYVRTEGEMVDLAILLSNAIASVTVGQDRTRQISEEIRGIFAQTLRNTSLVGKLIFKNTQGVQNFLKPLEKSRDAVAAFTEKFKGFDQASVRLAQTWQGIGATFKSLFTTFSLQAFGFIMDDLKAFMLHVLDVLKKNEILVTQVTFKIGALLKALGQIILDLILGQHTEFSVAGLLRALNSSIDKLGIKLVKVIFWINDVFHALKPLFVFFMYVLGNVPTLIRGVLTLLHVLGGRLFKVGEALYNVYLDPKNPLMLLGAKAALSNIFTGLFEELSTKLGPVFRTFWEDTLSAKGDLFKAFSDFFKQDIVKDASEAFYRYFTPAISEAAEFTKQFKEAQLDLDALLVTNIDSLYDYTELFSAANAVLKLSIARHKTLTALMRQMRMAQEGTIAGTTTLDIIKQVNKELIIIEDRIKSLRRMRGALMFAELNLEASGQMEQREKALLLIEKFGSEIDKLTIDANTLKRALIGIFDTKLTNVIDNFMNRLKLSFTDFFKIFNVDFRDFLDNAKDNVISLSRLLKATMKSVKDVTSDLLLATASAVAQAITDAFSGTASFGEGLLKAIKNFVGQALIYWGQYAVMIGTINLFMGILTKNIRMIAEGAKLIAVGTAAIALGVMLSGKGTQGAGVSATAAGGEEKIPEFAFDESQIKVQMGLMNATTNLVGAINTLTSMPPGVLVKEGAAQNGGMLRMTHSEAQSNISSARRLGATLLGKGNTGRF